MDKTVTMFKRLQSTSTQGLQPAGGRGDPVQCIGLTEWGQLIVLNPVSQKQETLTADYLF